MERVEATILRLHRLFSHQNVQEFRLSVPFERGWANAVIEKQRGRDVRGDVTSMFHFDVGDMKVQTSSDVPCEIHFSCDSVIPYCKSGVRFLSDDQCPAQMHNLFRRQINDVKVSSSQVLSMKVIPLSTELIDKSLFDLAGKLKIENRYGMIRVESRSLANLVSLEAAAKYGGKYAVRLDFSTLTRKLQDFWAVCAWEKDPIAVSLAMTQTRSVDFVTTAKLGSALAGGFSVTVADIGVCTKTVGKLAAHVQIDPSASLHVIVGSDRSLAGEFAVCAEDFFAMKFMGSSGFDNANVMRTQFGASLSFDLSKLTKHK